MKSIEMFRYSELWKLVKISIEHILNFRIRLNKSKSFFTPNDFVGLIEFQTIWISTISSSQTIDFRNRIMKINFKLKLKAMSDSATPICAFYSITICISI